MTTDRLAVQRVGTGALRVVGAAACLLAALIVVAIGSWAVLYVGSTGCEDVGVACRTAEPVVAAILAVSFIALAGSLLVLSVTLLLQSANAAKWRVRSSATAGASALFAFLLLAIR